jgi:hypothetical protein
MARGQRLVGGQSTPTHSQHAVFASAAKDAARDFLRGPGGPFPQGAGFAAIKDRRIAERAHKNSSFRCPALPAQVGGRGAADGRGGREKGDQVEQTDHRRKRLRGDLRESRLRGRLRFQHRGQAMFIENRAGADGRRRKTPLRALEPVPEDRIVDRRNFNCVRGTANLVADALRWGRNPDVGFR